MSRIKAIALALAAVLAACSGGESAPRRTQISQVNAVIDTVVARDTSGLRGLLQLTSLPCAETSTPAGPACEGEDPGTSVDAFQATECENRWLRRAHLDPLLDQLTAMEPAVYAAFESPEGFYLAGRYAVIFEGIDTRSESAGVRRYFTAGIEGNGLITGIVLGCSIEEPVHFLLPHANDDFDDWLIAP